MATPTTGATSSLSTVGVLTAETAALRVPASSIPRINSITGIAASPVKRTVSNAVPVGTTSTYFARTATTTAYISGSRNISLVAVQLAARDLDAT